MRITVNGTRLFFDVEGAKLAADASNPSGPLKEQPTLLVLHGGPGFDHAFFGNDHAPLASEAQIVYFEFRGNGLSERCAPDQLILEQWTDDVAAFCDALNIERPIVLGFSFGGFIAQRLAALYPGTVSKLVLVGTLARIVPQRAVDVFTRLGGEKAGRTARAMLFEGDPGAADDFFEHCLPLYWAGPPRLDRFARSNGPPDLLEHLVQNVLPDMDLFDCARAIQCPTLLLSGVDDPVTTVPDMNDLAAAIPESLVTLERTPRGAHFLVDDDPDWYFSAVRRFIRS